MEVVFARVDRVEPTQRAGWFHGWCVFIRGSEEFSQPFKFEGEPSLAQVEAEGRAYAERMSQVEE